MQLYSQISNNLLILFVKTCNNMRQQHTHCLCLFHKNKAIKNVWGLYKWPPFCLHLIFLVNFQPDAANQQLLIIDFHFNSLLLWSIQECINTMPTGKVISITPRVAIVATHQSGKGYKTKSLKCGAQFSGVTKITCMWKILQCKCSESWKKNKTSATSQTLLTLLSMLNVMSTQLEADWITVIISSV